MSWLISLFTDIPLRVALLMQNDDFMSVMFFGIFEFNYVNESWS